MATTTLDAQIMNFVKEINPSGAYLMGFNEEAGKLFVVSDANLKSALKKVRTLRSKAKTDLQKKLLASIETAILFDEPQPVLDDIVGTIFVHLVKEGVNDEHMLSLLECAKRDIAVSRKRFSKRKISPAVKVLALYRLEGVLEILDTIKGVTKSSEVKRACDSLKADVSAYVKLFEVEGFGHGEFANIEKIFRRQRFDMGRQGFYRRVLRDGYDYHESPEELEKKAMSWLDEELPKFRKVTQRLAKKLGCEATPEAVEQKINSRMTLDPKKLLGATHGIRRVVQDLVNEDVHGINPKYNTKVIETPSYLTGVIPTGAAQFFDTFARKPYQYFFQTTDPKRDPDKSVPALLNLLVHEEYGHCVHHSNSALGYMGKVPMLQLMPGAPTGAPITEGLSFNRELEFLDASRALEKEARLSKAEKAYVELMKRYGGLEQVNVEIEFITRRQRIIRFLRVVGDVWLNTGKKDLFEFIDWAHERTGVPKSSVYFQLVPAHEGAFPGYATTYAVVGQEIRAIERKIKDTKKRVKFSTYLCSIGFPPRSIYRRMLQDYSAQLK